MLVAASLVLVWSGTAHADPSIGLDPTSGPPLTVVKVSGIGYCPPPCSAVTIKIDTLNVASNVPVDGDGNFTAYVRMPGSARSGQVEVIASQTDGNGNVADGRTDFAVTVGQPAPTIYTVPPGSELPSGGLPTVTQPTTPSTDAPSSSTEPPATTVATTTTTTRPRSASSASRPSTKHEDSSDGWVLPVIVGVALVVALAIGGVWWLRRRRGASATGD